MKKMKLYYLFYIFIIASVLGWGILGVIWIKFCYPYIVKLIEKINYSFGKKLMIILILF